MKKIITIQTTQNKIISLLLINYFFILLIFVGILFNSLAVLNNECKMPVLDDSGYETKTHFSYTNPKEVNYPFFSDRFNIGKYPYSLGDFFDILGLIGFLISSVILVFEFHKLKNLKGDLKNDH